MEPLSILNIVLGIAALLFGIIGTAATCYGLHVARIQSEENKHLKRTFRAVMAGLYAPTARAIQWAEDMRSQTAIFKNPNPDAAQVARLMCLQTGRMEMHVNDVAAMITEFTREYLDLDMPRWKEIVQKLDENRNASAS